MLFRLLTVGVVAVVVLVLVGDLVLTGVVEDQASQRLGQELDTTARVELSGWPVVVRLLTGSGSTAVVRANDVPLRGTRATLTRLEARLTDVRVAEGRLQLGDGTFSASLDEAAVTRLVGLPEQLTLVGLRLREGFASVELGQFSVVRVAADVVDGVVVLRPTEPPLDSLRFPVRLDGLPRGVRLTSVRLHRNRLDIAGRVRGSAFGEFPLFPR